MKISTQNAKRLITRFENATIDYVHVGNDPDVERRYKQAKKTLTTFCIEAVIGDG